MFLLFKKVRNDHIKNGNIGKYLIYAIGEILLVVIGILIAMQVNNQNVEKKNRLVESQYYEAMRIQLMEDKSLLNDEIQGLSGRINDYVIGVDLIKNKNAKQLAELGDKVYRLLEHGDFRRKSSVYQTLISSGEITYINNGLIKRNLQELERAYQLTERLERTQANLIMVHTAPVVIAALDFESKKLVSPEIVYSHKFKNVFLVAIRLASEKKEEFSYALSVVDSTLKAIDAELIKG